MTSKQTVFGQRPTILAIMEAMAEKGTVFTYRRAKNQPLDKSIKIQYLGIGRLAGQSTSVLVKYLGQPFTCTCHSGESNDGEVITIRTGEVLTPSRIANCLNWAEGGSGRLNNDAWESRWVNAKGVSFHDMRKAYTPNMD